jgi:hypothetical protein
LVDVATDHINKLRTEQYLRTTCTASILELGVGSGCVLLSCLRELEQTNVRGVGVDISRAALHIAQLNANALGFADRTTLLTGYDGYAISPSRATTDIRHNALVLGVNRFTTSNNNCQRRTMPSSAIHRTFARVILHNYSRKYACMYLHATTTNNNNNQRHSHLALIRADGLCFRYEPHLALDGGEDGLQAYRDISAQLASNNVLDARGIVVLEVGYDQVEQVVEIVQTTTHMRHLQTFPDLFGYSRVVTFGTSNEINTLLVKPN